jgi:5-methyltetrahydropteroyltriglutamate--homocysteine methyltransferase
MFGEGKGNLQKKVCSGVVSHRHLQVDSPEQIAERIRHALKYIAPEQLIISSDCGCGRQGCNRDIAFFKATAIAQGVNIIRRELGLPTSPSPPVVPELQTDIVPKVEA